MRRRSDHARDLMYRVHLGRVHRGQGLRDSALLALIAAGLSAAEIAALRASVIGTTGGRVIITISRRNGLQTLVLPRDLGDRLTAWLTDRSLCLDWRDRTTMTCTIERYKMCADFVRLPYDPSK
jgi:hypothetical protein